MLAHISINLLYFHINRVDVVVLATDGYSVEYFDHDTASTYLGTAGSGVVN